MTDLIGYAGSFLLAICALPLAIEALRTGRDATNAPFFYLWFGGELFLLAHVLVNVEFDLPLILNYGTNVLFLSVVCFYRWFPRKYKNAGV